MTSYFLLLTSYFLLLTSYFFLLLTFYFLLLTSYFLLLTSYFWLLTSYFLLLTSYFLRRTSYFLLLTSYFLLRTSFRAQDRLRWQEKSSQEPPRPPNRSPRELQDALKTVFGSKNREKETKERPKTTQRAKGSERSRPFGSIWRPKRAPKRPPRAPKRSPREPQNALKTIFLSKNKIFDLCNTSKLISPFWRWEGPSTQGLTRKNRRFRMRCIAKTWNIKHFVAEVLHFRKSRF